MKQISLTRNMVAIVDDEDFEILSQYKWSYCKVGYATRSKNKKAVYMHRVITNAQPGQFVDHINLNKLDNRRENLRLCTKQQNQHNQGPRGGTSRFKGVSFRKDTCKFSAQIHVNYKKICLGSFKTEEEAAKVYNVAAIKYHGDFAYLNDV